MYESFGRMVSAEAFRETLRYFEFRKTKRLYGGLIREPVSSPLLGLATFLLWAFVFLLTSVTWKDNTLVFRFTDPSYLGGLLLYVGLGLQVITLILVLVAIQWTSARMLCIFFFTLLLSAIVHIVVRAVTSSEGGTQELALAIANLIFATVLAIVVGNAIWLYDFVPLFMGWRWTSITQNMNGPKSFVSFPFSAVMRLSFFLLLVLPLWFPLLAVIIINLTLQLLGAPMNFIFPWDVLFRLNSDYFELAVESAAPVSAQAAIDEGLALGAETPVDTHPTTQPPLDSTTPLGSISCGSAMVVCIQYHPRYHPCSFQRLLCCLQASPCCDESLTFTYTGQVNCKGQVSPSPHPHPHPHPRLHPQNNPNPIGC